MTRTKIWPILAVAFGAAFSLVGGGLIFGYIKEALIARIGDPDQSLLFWYLPILFIGIMTTGAGLAACTWGIIRLRGIGRTKPGKKEK